MIRLQRAYEKTAARQQGGRFLVERLWPRGIRKEDLPIDDWLKNVAPSTELRKWFSHDPAKWQAFRERYFRELDATPSAWGPLLDAARRGDVTLLFSSHDAEHNNAVALREYLERKLGARRAGVGRAAARKRAA
jgi:uncharacterized protein YeaO (DUF488 family)